MSGHIAELAIARSSPLCPAVDLSLTADPLEMSSAHASKRRNIQTCRDTRVLLAGRSCNMYRYLSILKFRFDLDDAEIRQPFCGNSWSNVVGQPCYELVDMRDDHRRIANLMQWHKCHLVGCECHIQRACMYLSPRVLTSLCY